MRVVVQRVVRGAVAVAGETIGQVNRGFVVFLGVGKVDDGSDARYLAEKIVNLRVFEDGEGKMNLTILDTGGAILAVSQFTLYGDCRKGRRPSFTDAAPPTEAAALYESFVAYLRDMGVRVETGRFQTMMQVEIVNDGPVTLLLDSKKTF